MEKQSTRQLQGSDDDEEGETNYHNEPWTPERREHMKTVRRRGKGLPDDLPQALEVLTLRSLKKLDKVIKLPIDAENGAALRSIVTSCGIAISSQLRADEQQLRAKAHGDALQRLLKIIEKEKHLLSADNDHKQKASSEDADRPIHDDHLQEHLVPISANDADGADHAIEIPSSGIDIEGE